jgi:hypothetical protein
MANQNLASIVRSSTREVFFFVSFYGPYVLFSLNLSSLSEVHLLYLHYFCVNLRIRTKCTSQWKVNSEINPGQCVSSPLPLPPPPIFPSFCSSKVSRANSRCESVPFYVCSSSFCALSAEANDKDVYLFVTKNQTEQKRYSPTFVTVAETTEKVSYFYVCFYFRPSDTTRLVQLQP